MLSLTHHVLPLTTVSCGASRGPTAPQGSSLRGHGAHRARRSLCPWVRPPPSLHLLCQGPLVNSPVTDVRKVLSLRGSLLFSCPGAGTHPNQRGPSLRISSEKWREEPGTHPCLLGNFFSKPRSKGDVLRLQLHVHVAARAPVTGISLNSTYWAPTVCAMAALSAKKVAACPESLQPSRGGRFSALRLAPCGPGLLGD